MFPYYGGNTIEIGNIDNLNDMGRANGIFFTKPKIVLNGTTSTISKTVYIDFVKYFKDKSIGTDKDF